MSGRAIIREDAARSGVSGATLEFAAAIDAQTGDAVQIRVVDTGPGIGQGSPEHLFEPFVTTKPQGLGVGLSISAGIVETHGSELRVETDPGTGTSFRFTLALESQDVPASP